MEALAESVETLSLEERIGLDFALAKAHDDLGEYETAFQHLAAGNAAHRALHPYDEAATMTQFDAIVHTCTREVLCAHAGEGELSTKPVFIVGMPRSRTSLADDSHKPRGCFRGRRARPFRTRDDAVGRNHSERSSGEAL